MAPDGAFWVRNPPPSSAPDRDPAAPSVPLSAFLPAFARSLSPVRACRSASAAELPLECYQQLVACQGPPRSRARFSSLMTPRRAAEGPSSGKPSPLVFIFSAFPILLCSSVLLPELIVPLAGGNGGLGFSPHKTHFMFCSPGCRVIFPGSLSEISVGGLGDSFQGWEGHQVVNIMRSDFPTEPGARALMTLSS